MESILLSCRVRSAMTIAFVVLFAVAMNTAAARNMHDAGCATDNPLVLVLDETDGEAAQLVCERIRQEVERQVITTDKGNLSVTLSLGIASYPEDGLEKEALIEKADQALYMAKQSGRNQTARYGRPSGPRAAAVHEWVHACPA